MTDTFAEGWDLSRIAEILSNSDFRWERSLSRVNPNDYYTDEYCLRINERRDYILLLSSDRQKLIARIEGDISKRIPEYRSVSERPLKLPVMHIDETGIYAEGWDFKKTAILVSNTRWQTICGEIKSYSYYSYGKYRLRLPKDNYSQTLLTETYDPYTSVGTYDIARVNPPSQLLFAYKHGNKHHTKEQVVKCQNKHRTRHLLQGLLTTFIICIGGLFWLFGQFAIIIILFFGIIFFIRYLEMWRK